MKLSRRYCTLSFVPLLHKKRFFFFFLPLFLIFWDIFLILFLELASGEEIADEALTPLVGINVVQRQWIKTANGAGFLPFSVFFLFPDNNYRSVCVCVGGGGIKKSVFCIFSCGHVSEKQCRAS